MIKLIPAIIIMLYYWLFRIKSYGKLLIFSTRCREDREAAAAGGQSDDAGSGAGIVGVG
jgi:hypothetical protein